MGFETGAREWQIDLENNRKVMNMALGILTSAHSNGPNTIYLVLITLKDHFPSEDAPD